MIAPEPLAAQLAPPEVVQDQLWLAMPVATGSVTGVPSAATGPVLLTTTVYVIVPPGVSVVTLAVFVTLICGTEATLTVLVHGAGVLPGVQMPPGGGVAVAVLSTDAGALFATVAVTV